MASLLLLLSVEWEVAPGDDQAQEEQAAHDEGKGDGGASLLLLRVEWEVAPGDDEAQEEQAAYDEGEGGWLLSCCYSVWNER